MICLPALGHSQGAPHAALQRHNDDKSGQAAAGLSTGSRESGGSAKVQHRRHAQTAVHLPTCQAQGADIEIAPSHYDLLENLPEGEYPKCRESARKCRDCIFPTLVKPKT